MHDLIARRGLLGLVLVVLTVGMSMGDEAADAPGWNAIDARLERVYGKQNRET